MKVALICLLFIGGLVAAAYGVPAFENEDQLRDYLENIWEVPGVHYPPGTIRKGPSSISHGGSNTGRYLPCRPGQYLLPNGQCSG